MLVPVLQILGGLVLLVLGADLLVRGAAKLARLMGLSPFAIGVTVVAFGTSAPELFATARAAMAGAGDLGIGNVVGSNIANVLLILGITTIISPIKIEPSVFNRSLPIMLAISVIASAMLFMGDQTIGTLEGVVLLVGLISYVVYSFKAGKADPESLAHEFEREVAQDMHLDKPEPRSKLGIDFGLMLLGLAALSYGSGLLVSGAQALAIDVLGVSPGLVGLTVVAFGTSLPELAASIRATIGKQHAMAIGNVVGSNVFNLLSVLGVSAMIEPLTARAGIGPDLLVMLAAAVLCYPVLSKNRTITRAQGIVMVTGYTAYMVVVYLLES